MFKEYHILIIMKLVLLACNKCAENLRTAFPNSSIYIDGAACGCDLPQPLCALCKTEHAHHHKFLVGQEDIVPEMIAERKAYEDYCQSADCEADWNEKSEHLKDYLITFALD